MSSIAILVIAGLSLIFGGERLWDAYATVSWTLDGLGLALMAFAVHLRIRGRSANENGGVRFGHDVALRIQGTMFVSLIVYALSTKSFMDMVGFESVMADRWGGVLGALWPIGLLVGLLAFLAVDRAIQRSPVAMPRRGVRQALNNGLIAGLAICLVFPVNYIASRHDTEWDFSYFKTAKPGTTTRAIVDGLENPVDVRIFQSTSSEVTPELMQYFRGLEGPNLRVEVLDQAADPQLAQYLRVRDNGYVSITSGAVNLAKPDPTQKPPTQVVKIGENLRAARLKLKKLDAEIGKALMALSRGQMTAYITQGHGEFTWDKKEAPQRSLQGFKQLLEQWNFKAKKFGLTEGLGDEVPADADVVIIVGPSKAFLPAEVAALSRYLDRGGSLVVALEPTKPGATALSRDALDPLLKKLAVRRGDGVLASMQQIVAVTRGKLDRMNVTTDKFSPHPSTAVLADARTRLFVSMAGHLELADGAKAKATPTVRSSASTWADLDGDLDFDEGKEVKKSRTIAYASAGGTGDSAWRAISLSDATLFSDLAIVVSGNQQLLDDGLKWLVKMEAYSGTTETEEDVKIEHTQEGQIGWFYATVLGFPVFVMILGMVRTRRRGGRS